MKKNIIVVMLANIVCLLINLIINFVLPQYLSIESYAEVKAYALYISYAGFFSLGYNDGMYLKYGGKLLKDISTINLGNNIKNYFFIESLFLIMILVLSVGVKSELLFLFALGMFTTNILGYMKSLYQATGEFKLYSKTLNIEKILILILNLVLIFLLQIKEPIFYIIIQILVGIILCIYLVVNLESNKPCIFRGKLSFNVIWDNIKMGFIMMLGNFSVGIFSSIDRWFIKILMTVTNFAMYSFSASMQNIIMTFTTPISISLYNYMCITRDVEKIKRLKKYCLIWGFIIIAAAFPAKFILENYLKKYVESSTVILYLFAAQAFSLVINGIYVNLYKVEKKQNKYLRQIIMMIGLSVILNMIFYYISRTMEAIACATFMTSVIWLILCELEERDLRFSIKEIVAVLIMTLTYFLVGIYFNSVVGCIIYCLIGVFVITIFMHDTVLEILQMIKSMLSKPKPLRG